MANAKKIELDHETFLYIRDQLNESLYGTVITNKHEARKPDGLDELGKMLSPAGEARKLFEKNYQRLRKINIVLNCLELTDGSDKSLVVMGAGEH